MSQPNPRMQLAVSQSGTSAPTIASTFRNSIGAPTLARTGAGTYTVTKTGAFTANKTKMIICPVDNAIVGIVRTSANVLTITTRDNAGVLADDILSATLIDVEIMP